MSKLQLAYSTNNRLCLQVRDSFDAILIDVVKKHGTIVLIELAHWP